MLKNTAIKRINKPEEEFMNYEIDEAFILNHRILHYRVAIKYELLEMKIVESDKCSFWNNRHNTTSAV